MSILIFVIGYSQMSITILQTNVLREVDNKYKALPYVYVTLKASSPFEPYEALRGTTVGQTYDVDGNIVSIMTEKTHFPNLSIKIIDGEAYTTYMSSPFGHQIIGITTHANVLLWDEFIRIIENKHNIKVTEYNINNITNTMIKYVKNDDTNLRIGEILYKAEPLKDDQLILNGMLYTKVKD